MADVHQHAEDRNAYYLDQLFMIGVCGALAGVTLMLWQSGLLNKMLHPKFHIWVILGGISLLSIVVLRAIAVWRSVDEEREHRHEHGPGCDHSHGHGHEGDHGHGHGHGHGEPAPGGSAVGLALAPAAAVPAHGHGHSHSHSHSHAHGDHEHSAQPWRYVILLFPVALYFFVLSQPTFGKDLTDKPTDPVQHITNFIVIFRSILWEALPFIILGAIIAGLLEELLPQRVLVALLPRSRPLAIGMGCLLGLVFPMCECGIIPIMRRLLRKGLPLSCCIAYLLAGPIINFIVLLSTYAAFSGMENVFVGGEPSYQMGSWWMLGFRAGLGFVVAYVTALLVEWQYSKYGDSLLTPLARPKEQPAEEEGNGERRTLWQRVNNISETALHDFVDITVFLIIGALLSASTRLVVSPEEVGAWSQDNALLAIAAMMGLAIVLCLCSEADAFVAASFVTLRPSAKLAFLVLGPMLDFKLYAMYTRIFRPRLILTIYAAVLIQVFLYSTAVHYFWETYKERLITPQRQVSAPQMSEEDRHALAAKTAQLMGLVAMPAPGGSYIDSYVCAAAMTMVSPSVQSMELSPLQLEAAAGTPEMRNFYSGRRVKVIGKFSGDEQRFMVLRYKMNCCVADATAVRVPFIIDPNHKGPPLHVNKLKDQWVDVTGNMRFVQDPRNGAWQTVILISPREGEPLDQLVKVVPMPANPFLY